MLIPRTASTLLAIAPLCFGISLATEQLPSGGTGKLFGKIHDSKGMAARNVTIILTHLSGAIHDITVSDADGAFEFTGLQPDQYELETFSTVFEPIEKQVITIKPKQTIRLNLTAASGLVVPT